MSSQPSALSAKLSASSVKAPSNQTSPAASATQQFFSNDSSLRRPSSSASVPRQPAARNAQTSKPKHKGGKRFKPLNIDEDVEAERYSMQNPHGRRGQQSITHLMNFALPPRPQQQQLYHRHNFHAQRRGGRANQTWGLGSGYHATDKARYIHANYRFIVDPRGDYHAQAEDADVHLDWTNVLQIIASSKSQTASCPICLGEPTAPRMAKCGHMFCLPCLIRYMNSDEGTAPANEKKARWKKCPICWDSIYISETRPVRWYAGQECDLPREGGDIVLRLVRRKPGSTLAMPRESAEVLATGEDIPWHHAAEAMDYSRVLKGSEDYMLQQYDQAISDVERLEKEDELMFGEDAEWTGRAIRMLNEAKDKVRGIGNPPLQPQKPEHIASDKRDIRLAVPLESMTSIHDQNQDNTQASPATASLDVDSAQAMETTTAYDDQSYVPRTLGEMRHRQAEKPQPSEYLFYHALQHYYLSPLDIRILKTAFGSYNSFPSSILPRVERVSAGHVVDDELRKRVKYLAHLPYGCEVAFLECDWTDTVPSSVLNEFHALLQRRRKRHDEKEAREEKERIRIEKAEEKEMAAVRRKRPSIPNDAFSSEMLPPLGSEFAVLSEDSLPEATGGMSPPWPHRSTSGFASLASPSTSPNMSRTVWGTAAVAPSSPDLHATLPRDAAFHEDDGWLQGWEKDLLDQREQQLATEIENLELQGNQTKPGGGAKKNKKGKKITLMSTTARRGA